MKAALVAHFLGHVPPMRVFASMADQLWGSEGLSWVVSQIGHPLSGFVREGLDVKVCVLLAAATACLEEVTVLLEDDERVVIPVSSSKSRLYNKPAPVWKKKASAPLVDEGTACSTLPLVKDVSSLVAPVITSLMQVDTVIQSADSSSLPVRNVDALSEDLVSPNQFGVLGDDVEILMVDCDAMLIDGVGMLPDPVVNTPTAPSSPRGSYPSRQSNGPNLSDALRAPGVVQTPSVDALAELDDVEGRSQPTPATFGDYLLKVRKVKGRGVLVVVVEVKESDVLESTNQ
ncbi:hypothetical protein LINGRAHAP2_LOCUS33351 [Linum grandiflorum]